MDKLIQGDFGTLPTDWTLTTLGLLLAFLCGHGVAWIYIWTHSGLSYSRSFVNSLIVMPVIVALVMMVLSNNLVTAFGLMAVFAIVRFRNILRDTLDTTYVLAVIVIGMACGTWKFATAVIGCALTALIMLYLYSTSFGSRHRYDVILNLHWGRPLSQISEVDDLLGLYTIQSARANQRALDDRKGADFSYRLLMRDPSTLDALLAELRTIPGVSRVTGLMADSESEI